MSEFLVVYREEIILSLIGVAAFLGFWALYRVGVELFAIYRREFLSTVDKGFRDVLIYLDPGQVFLLSTAIIIIAIPILLYITSVVTTVIILTVMIMSPGIILRRLKKQRADLFIKQLPDGLTSMSSALSSGLNLIHAIEQTVKNQPDPLSSELAQVLVEYRVGKDLIESLDDLAARLDKEELVLLSSSLNIAREFGGNVAETIQSLSETLREQSVVQAKVMANTALGRAQGVLSMLLPVVVGYAFYSFEPDSMSRLFTTPLGQLILGGMIFWMFLGWTFINRITKIDI